MSTYWTIFKKEWLSYLKNRRGLLISFFLFGLFVPLGSVLPYFIITINVVSQMGESIKVAVSGLEQAPLLAEYSGGASQITFIPVENAEMAVKQDGFLVGMIIPTDFEESLINDEPSRIELVSKQSQVIDATTMRVEKLLQQYKRDIVNQRLAAAQVDSKILEPFSISSRQIVTEGRFQRSYLSWLLVFMVTFYAFALSAPNAIKNTAGEKEQFSMEVLLLSPVSRASILLGKITFVITHGLTNLLMSGLSTALIAIGAFFSLPLFIDIPALQAITMASADPSAPVSQFSLPQFSALGIFMVMVLILTTIFIFTVLQFAVGLWARDESQANNILSLINLIPSLTTLVFFIDSYQPESWHYLIPVLSQTLLIPDMLVNRFELLPLLLSFLSSLIAILLMLAGMIWMMNQEEIIYSH